MIRILHIIHSMDRGGAENTLMNYYRHIDRSKIQFDFLLTSKEKCQFEDEIIKLGGYIFRIPQLVMFNPFPYLNGVKVFLKEHSEYKIVHSHTNSKSFFPLYIAKKLGVPIRISHSHSSMSENGIYGLIRSFLKPLLNFVVTERLACGKQAGEYLYGKQTQKQGKVNIFRNVIEADKFRFFKTKRLAMREALKIGNETFVLGHTARFDPVKNHKFDIEVLVELKKLFSNVKLLEVGLGVEEGISDFAKEKGVYCDIIFTGLVDNVYDYEQVMDAFILPSFNEGLPLSIIEAQVSGLPCFTTENCVSKECSVTDLVSYIPLEAGAEKWALSIYSSRNYKRIDRYNEIVAAGYDAKSSAEKLQNFYLSKIKEYYA